jgi:hypothetical protein
MSTLTRTVRPVKSAVAALFVQGDDDQFRPVVRPTAEEIRAAGAAADAIILTNPTEPRPAALDWPESDEVDGWVWEPTEPHDFTVDTDTANEWNNAAADEDMASRIDAEADAVARVLTLDEHRWLDAIEADRADESLALDRLCAGCLL